MIGVVVAIQHPAYEMRDQVLTLRPILLELTQQVHVELPFFLCCGELRVFIDPALVASECGDLLLPEGFKLLIEVDAPGGETDHFVASWLMGKRVHVDEGGELLVGYAAHFARDFIL